MKQARTRNRLLLVQSDQGTIGKVLIEMGYSCRVYTVVRSSLRTHGAGWGCDLLKKLFWSFWNGSEAASQGLEISACFQTSFWVTILLYYWIVKTAFWHKMVHVEVSKNEWIFVWHKFSGDLRTFNYLIGVKASVWCQEFQYLAPWQDF